MPNGKRKHAPTPDLRKVENLGGKCSIHADAHKARELILTDLTKLRKAFEHIPKTIVDRTQMTNLSQEIAANAVVSGVFIQQTADLFVAKMQNYIKTLQENPGARVPKDLQVACEALENAANF